VEEMIPEAIAAAMEKHIDPQEHPTDWDLEGLFRHLKALYPVSFEPEGIDLRR